MSALVESLEHPLLRKLRGALIVLVLLALVGLLTRPLEAPAWTEVREAQVEMNLGEVEGALGQGLVVGMLGGFRTIMADFLWIRLNSNWEQRDLVKVSALCQLVTTLDPRPDFFWINSARITAYDMPNWRIRKEGGNHVVPESRQAELDRQQAEQAFAIIQRGLRFHPENPQLHLEMGQIYLNRLKDYEQAAKWFLSASELPGAPYYAARIYSELLRRQGKNHEAYAYLKDLFLSLPEDPYAQHGVIYERIQELEEELSIPLERRFVPEP